MKTVRILHLEDNEDDANLIQTLIKRSDIPCDIEWVDSKEKFESAVLNPEINLVLADYTLPNYNGMAALQFTKEKRPGLPFILITGTIGEEKTIEFFHTGLTDFLMKNNLQRVASTIKRALNEVEEKNKREIAEKELRHSHILFRQFIEAIPEVFWQASPDLDKIVFVSPPFEEIWGIKIEDLYKNSNLWFDAIVDEDKPKVKKAFFTMSAENKQKAEVEYKITRPDGLQRSILARAAILKDENFKTIGLIGIAIDITEQAKMIEKIKASLGEKEAMLKEIYHRVKNNLQVVSSLLNLQSKTIKDPISKKIFIESSMRIKSMALVHEMLYTSSDLSQIEMAAYVDKLANQLRLIYHADSNLIKLKIDADSVRLTIDDAIPCGLIINELITNAFKYAFPGGQAGEIQLSIKKKENRVSLIVGDNGIGLSPELDFKNTTTLGMQLINSLTKQLTGEIALDRERGTQYTLTFKTKE